MRAGVRVPHIARAGGGSIVNIGGETGHRGAAGRAHVVTAKAGLAGLTKALALDLAPQRITVNCVVPGRIDTVRAGSGDPGSARPSAGGAADRAARHAGRSGRDGAHAVRSGRALHHRTGDPRQRRRVSAMTSVRAAPAIRTGGARVMQPTRRTVLKSLGASRCCPPRAISRTPRTARPRTRTSRSRSSRRCSPAAASISSPAPIADRLGRALGQSIVVENQSGGGGIVGSLAVARAAPDGYTLMVGYVGTHGTNPAVRKLPYDADQGLHADRDGRRHAERAGRPAVAAGQHAEGIHPVREGQCRQALLRLIRPRHAHPPRDGAAEGRRRPRSRARSVSRHRPRDHRHPRRPDAGALSRPRRRRCRTSRPARCGRSPSPE